MGLLESVLDKSSNVVSRGTVLYSPDWTNIKRVFIHPSNCKSVLLPFSSRPGTVSLLWTVDL